MVTIWCSCLLTLDEGLPYDDNASPDHSGTSVESSDPHHLGQHNFITISSNHDSVVDPTLLVQAANR
jgi:hypothetical protein